MRWRCFVASPPGAVIASLATGVYPKAYKEDSYVAGVATAIGVVLTFRLDKLG